MFSGSSAFLGGSNSARPGQPSPFGQQQLYGQQQQPGQQQTQYGQQQSQFMTGQPTGYPNSNPLQNQYTGYPQQPLSQQPTQGQQFSQYGAQQPNHFQAQQQAPLIQQPTSFQQPPAQQSSQFQASQQAPLMQQPTSFPQLPAQQTAAPQQVSQPTGMTSSQMANSFRSSSLKPTPMPTTSTGFKIPNIRLSFITASDQAKFEQLFKSAVGTGQAMTGEQARELLLRSKLPGDSLAHIWMLSDTTKSGQLLFPEFALAMYLCNLKLNGKEMPSTLPERVRNEVSSMVDIISFGIPDEKPLPPIQTNAPNFTDSRDSNRSPPAIQQPQPQQSTTQLLASLNSQPTGMMPQMTGYANQMGMMPQATGMPQQQTGYPGMPQATGYNGPMPPLPPMPTGFGASPIAPLNSQPTGMPGQWGLVNTPATGLPNIEALHRQMMPQAGREAEFTTVGLAGNATIPWAVTKDEKKIYDDIFKAWDGFGKGYVSGDQAIEIMGQSGLEKSDLERIWTLSDPNNKGRLNLDEFAVAMHLIYRKLNGYPVPNRLPPELTPPSTRNLNDSIGTVKSLLQRDAEQRKSSGAYIQPQKTGVSYLKSHSFRQSSPLSSRADGTIFKNDDESAGYRSSARHRVGAGRTPSPAISSSTWERHDELTGDQLRKLIKEKQILLDAVDFDDENQAEEDETLDRRDRRDAEDLYRRIRQAQEDIDAHPNMTKFSSGGSDAERRQLGRQLQTLNDRLPELASQVRRCERAIADAQLELFRLKDAKANPGSTPIVGTGPGGIVTENDRLRARAKALMQQRSAALSGRSTVPSGDDPGAASQRFEAESSRIRDDRERNERMVQDVEESVSSFGKALEDSLKEGAPNSSAEHERRRWEDGLGVEEEVRDFVFELQRQSESARSRKPDTRSSSARNEEYSGRSVASSVESKPAAVPSPAPSSSATSPSYASYRTAEERAAYIKQQAEQRMAERLAALGIKPAKVGETPQQRAERERKEHEDRLRKAEQEDAQREQERQRRLADEEIAPPTAGKQSKKPPPPPSRKSGTYISTTATAIDTRKEQELRQEQEAQEAERKRLEEEERRQEAEVAKEKEAQEARLRALEEQVRQGKLRKEEEKKRRQAEQKAAKERDARLAAQKAEIEAARQREKQLQAQLEGLGDDSSDDDGLQQMTPQGTGTTPAASLELTPSTSQASIPSAPPIPNVSVSSSPHVPTPPQSVVRSPEVETKNPFLKKMQAESANAAAPTVSQAAASESTNPFHRLAQQENKAGASDTPTASSRAARMRTKDDDDWSVMDESSSDEEEGPIGGGAKQLASLLFGTMAPPRPLSAMEDKSPSSTAASPPPVPAANGSVAPPAPPMPGSGPPPPPPMPSSNAPPPPPMPGSGPPPPPPMPGSVAPKAPGGAPDRSNLLTAIRSGTGLKKVETKDRSASSVAGRVL